MAATASSSATASASQSVRLAKRAMRKSMGARLAALSREDILAQSSAIATTLLRSELYRNARTVSIYLNTPSGEVDTHELCLDALRNRKTLYVPSFAIPASVLPPSAESSKAKPQFAAEMSMLHILSEDDLLSLPANSYGIREPSLDDKVDTPRGQRTEALAPSAQGGTGLDLILCPGLAFDLYGGRLGHGKGYYDRYLLRAKEWALREQERRDQDASQTGPGNAKEVRLPVVLALSLRQQVLGHESASSAASGSEQQSERVPMDDRDVQLDGILTPDALILPSAGAPATTRPSNDAKFDPIPEPPEKVAELAEAGKGHDWTSWGFGNQGLKLLRDGKEVSQSSMVSLKG
ncbi:hypothetical protein OC846_006320 [Tilletia horrida]|uniref:5-formyltetrahydrofolate cyclo-ligase n=1 Tax=Tilletia horrida TaxID=155126 RepID=A0AAN6GLJ1_9BASI|nr:hypothetical protein OC846_006320 [Tilletia horrida]KAK0562734.1 hypothetical protein OC861_005177 [Tilletia horrida]